MKNHFASFIFLTLFASLLMAHPHGQEYGKLVDGTIVTTLLQIANKAEKDVAEKSLPYQAQQLKVVEPDYTLAYDLFAPKDTTQKRPLIIALEQLDSRAVRNKVKFDEMTTGTLRLPETQKKNPAYIVRPKLNNKLLWEGFEGRDVLNAMLTKLLKDHKIDKNRIYIIGISKGGLVAWNWAQRKPKTFAALVLISSRIIPYEEECKTLNHMPIRFYHGSDDRSVSSEFSRQIFAEFVLQDGKGWFYEYVNIRHNAWRIAMTDPLLNDWMFEQDKSTPVKYPLKGTTTQPATQPATQPSQTQPTTLPASSTQPASSQPSTRPKSS